MQVRKKSERLRVLGGRSISISRRGKKIEKVISADKKGGGADPQLKDLKVLLKG